MASGTLIFTRTQRRVLTAILLVLIACSAVAARHHDTHDRIVATERRQIEKTDYLLWHRQATGGLEFDSLNDSLRLFSTIADKLASDASGAGDAATDVAHTSSEPARQDVGDR